MKTYTQIEQKCQNFSRFLRILSIALLIPSIASDQLEYQRQREEILKFQLENYVLSQQDGIFALFMVKFFFKNLNIEPDSKGFGEPKSSYPSKFSKKMKDLLKSLKLKQALKELMNSLIYLYSRSPYKYIFLILMILVILVYIRQVQNQIQFYANSRRIYITQYLMELNSRLRLIELFERYKKAKFFKSRSFENLPFQNVPITNSLKSLTNLEIEEYKHLEQAIRDNKLKSRLLVYQITKLAQELNLNPKSTLTLILLSLLVLRFRSDSPDTASFILIVKFLLKMFGSTDSNSWPDSNE